MYISVRLRSHDRVFALLSSTSLAVDNADSLVPGKAPEPPETNKALASDDRKIGDQPLDRFWRKCYAMFRSRRMQHNRHLWPYVSIGRDEQGAINTFSAFGRQVALTPLHQAFRERHDTVHMILSGPSVGEIQYDRLPIQAAMGVNGSISLARQFDIPFKYYCVIDQNFVRGRIDLMREVVARDLTLFVTPDVLRYMVQGLPPEHYKCRVCVVELVSERAFLPHSRPEELTALAQSNPAMSVFDAQRSLGYSFDLAHGVFDADTVAYAALQILVAGGVDHIYMHGLDLGFSGARRFYNEAQPENSRLVRNFDRLIEPSFSQAAALLKARGVRLFNLSMNSALSDRVIPKIDWRTLVS
jgi:KDO transferase-3